MNDIYSHDTEKMGNWSEGMRKSSSNYRLLIDELYSIIRDFAGSPDFRGGLSTDLIADIEGKYGFFLQFEDLFNESAKIVDLRAKNITDDEAYLQSRIANNNPMDL